MAYKRISPQPVVEGGTGASTLTGVLVGNGTSAVTASSVTQYNVQVGGASNALTSVAPSATSGIALVSQGAASNPAFSTVVVAGGGTGITTTTAYAPLCGGTTATGAFQAADSGISNVGYVLTSTGAASLPTWQAAGGGGGVSSLAGNSGGGLTGALNLVTSNSTVTFSGSGSTITQDFDLTNVIFGSSLPSLSGGTGLVGIGAGVLDATTTGNNKIAIGSNAMGLATSGKEDSIAIGTNALGGRATGGEQSIAIGTNALSGDFSGANSIAIGYTALESATTANSVIAIGRRALNNLSTGGTSCIAIGNDAMFGVTGSATNSIGIGTSTLSNASFTGTSCIAIGTNVLDASTTGNSKIGIGTGALGAVSTGGVDSIAIGSGALDGATTAGGTSIAIGTDALGAAYTGSGCIAIGYQSLDAATSADNNTAVGTSSLGALTTGDGNTALGNASGSSYTTESNNITIGNTGTATDSGAIRIGANGTHTSAYISGIDGVDVGNVAKVVTMASDQLGTATITGGTGITITPTANTITIDSSGSGIETITGDSGGALSGSNITFTGGTTGLAFAGSGTTETLGGTLVVANGGTGATTLTGVLTGNGTSAITANAVTQYAVLLGGASNAVGEVSGVGTSGQVLTSNGAGMNPTWQDAGGGASIQIAKVTLTSSQVKNLRGTPIQIIPAPAANEVIMITSHFARLNYGGSNAFVCSASQDIMLYYGNTSGPDALYGIIPDSFITATSDQVAFYNYGDNISTAAATSYEGRAVVVSINNATEISGNVSNNNTIDIQVTYWIAGA